MASQEQIRYGGFVSVYHVEQTVPVIAGDIKPVVDIPLVVTKKEPILDSENSEKQEHFPGRGRE